MNPEELREKILKVAEYLGSEEIPSRAMTAASIRTLLTEVRLAGSGEADDFKAVIGGLKTLIGKLTKSARTLNPQDEARGILEESASKLKAVLGVVTHEFDYVSSNVQT